MEPSITERRGEVRTPLLSLDLDEMSIYELNSQDSNTGIWL